MVVDGHWWCIIQGMGKYRGGGRHEEVMVQWDEGLIDIGKSLVSTCKSLGIGSIFGSVFLTGYLLQNSWILIIVLCVGCLCL